MTKFMHLRYSKDLHFLSTKSNLCRHDVHPMGGVTIAWDGNRVGISICSLNDIFIKRVGREKSLARLEEIRETKSNGIIVSTPVIYDAPIKSTAFDHPNLPVSYNILADAIAYYLAKISRRPQGDKNVNV